MITLKTLRQATAQEVFDQVANHLLTQSKKSKNDQFGCMYKNSDNLKCAAGCLIADDEYDSNMEDRPWKQLVARKYIPTGKHSALIGDLQFLHDFVDVAEWPAELKDISKRRRLKWKW